METLGYGSLLNNFFEKHKSEILKQYKPNDGSSSSSSNASESGDSDSNLLLSPLHSVNKMNKDMNIFHLNNMYKWNDYTDESVNSLREAFVQYLYDNETYRSKDIITDIGALPNKFETSKERFALLSSQYIQSYNLDENSHMGYYCYMNEGEQFDLTVDGVLLTFTKADGVCDLQYSEGQQTNRKTKQIRKMKKGKKFSIDLFNRDKPIRFKFGIGSTHGSTEDPNHADSEPIVPICILEDQEVFTDNRGWVLIQNVTTDDIIQGMDVISVQKQNVEETLIHFPKDCFGENVPNKDVYVTHDHVVYDPIKNKLSNAGMLTYEYNFLKVCNQPPKNHTYSILLKKWKLMNVNNLKCESIYPFGDTAIKLFSQKQVFKDVSELEWIREYMFVKTTDDLFVEDDVIRAKEFNNRLGV